MPAGRLRQVAKRVLGPSLSFLLHNEWLVLRQLGARFFVRWNAMLADAYVRDRRSRSRYWHLTEDEARAARTSDTVFVFGCGGSLNDRDDEEWERFARHDVFGFKNFFREPWIAVDFHLFRNGVMTSSQWRPYAELVARRLRASPHFVDTIFLMQEEFLAQFSNQLIGYRLLPEGARVLRYRTARGHGPPTRRLTDGLRHVVGTLDDSINAAFALGWREIVLVGVDLYDSRYLWLPEGMTETADRATGQVFPAAADLYRGNASTTHTRPHSAA